MAAAASAQPPAESARAALARSSSSLRGWSLIHTWSSLICTLFLLVICLTGLPLIFREEIEGWLDDVTFAALPSDMPAASLDGIVAAASRRHADQIVASIFLDDDEPQVVVSMARSWQDFAGNPSRLRALRFDARSGALLKDADPPEQQRIGFLALMLRLHTDLFGGLPGGLFLGAMGLTFVAAIVSGVVLYGPFMRKLRFGTVRAGRSPRLTWLDRHNLLGIIALAWSLVLGATGTINELSLPLFALWQKTELAAVLQPWRGQAVPPASALSSPQAAIDAAKRALPGMRIVSIIYPGSPFGSPYHYLVWAKGDTPLTGRLFSPVLIDARTGKLASVVKMPWYLVALELSRPLHFGDYGGTPLKVVWALFDGVTIAILGSGLYLWLSRRGSRDATTIDGGAAEARAADGAAERRDE